MPGGNATRALMPAETGCEKVFLDAVCSPMEVQRLSGWTGTKGGRTRVDKNEKQAQVKELTTAFGTVAGAVLTGVAGLTVAESTSLRRKFHQAGVQYRVVKNTLARLATSATDLKVISEMFVGPTAIAWHPTDPSAAAKVAMDVKKELEKLEIKGGYLSGTKLDANGVKAAASMPTLPELRATLLGTINAPAQRLLAQLNAPGQQIAGVLKAWADKQGKAA
jgi:large subunit ribosomal protein L10